MKKFMMGLFLAALATTQLANADTFTDRRALLDKAKAAGNKVIEIGFNAGSSGSSGKKDELFFWTNKYWPMANSLTTQTGENISLIPENDARVLLNLVRSQKYKWLFVQPHIAVVAQEHGYTPLGYMNKEFESVFVVAEGGVSKTSDLKGKTIATLANSNDLRLAKYYLHTENWDAKFVEIGASGYGEVEAQLVLKKVDAIAVNRDIANQIIKRNKGFKVLATSGGVPRAVLLAHISVSNDQVDRISGALLKIPGTAMLPTELGFAATDTPFLAFTKDHLRYMRAALGYIEPDYGRSIYDPKVNKYIESQEAFTDGIVKPVLKTPNP